LHFVRAYLLEMSHAHVFKTWPDPYPSQQTCNPLNLTL